MTAWTFTLPLVAPPYGLSLNDRAHWGRKAAATAMVRLMVVAAVKPLEIPPLSKCRVEVVWVVSTTHRRDEDNLAPLLKAIYDGLGADTGVSAHIVPDDAPQFMLKPGATIRYEKGCTPHFEITVTALGGDA